ncbi:MAG TPA: DUF4870 domain-containing protein [Microbacteriaceae bacterium]|nr:DUF4870 domain-containing protein [Microbacteriaceae bacterium]
MTDTPNTVEMSDADQRMWATLVHIGGVLFGIIPSLVAYLVLRERGPFIRAHAATALNFQISMLIYVAASVIVSVPLMLVLIGFLTMWLVPIAASILIIIFGIIAAIAANRGEPYRYPLTIQFVR